jgi:ubiquinone/menaquinone biosynthesis C-methylase UbiE
MARQLGRPEGLRGRMVGRGLNKGNRTAVTAAVAATGVGPGQAAADIGFGGGIGLQLLLERVGADGHVDGVELSVTMLAAARRRYRTACSEGSMTLHAGTLGDLPLEDGSLDGLITTNTVYFVEDLPQAFGEIARVLRPTGIAVVGVGDPEWMRSMPVTAHGFRIRPVDALISLLHQAGLTDVRDERVGETGQVFHLLSARRAP